MKTKIILHILNGMEIDFFFAMLLIGVVGMLIFFAADVRKAIREDSKTPEKFSFKFLLLDKGLNLFIQFVCLCLCIVYFKDITKLIFQVETGLEINGAVAFFLGLGINRIAKDVVNYGLNPSKNLLKNIVTGKQIGRAHV